MDFKMMYELNKEHFVSDPSYKALEEKLLSYGGRKMVRFPQDPLVTNRMLIEKGELFDPAETGLRMMLSKPNNCHGNCINWWRRFPDCYRIVHGYGLSEDGGWRNHSWLWHKKDGIVETTVPRTAYYGCILDDAQADAFARDEAM